MYKKKKQRHNLILNEIKKDFRVKNLVYCEGYFIFTMGKFAICQFTVKEIKDWKFAIWLGEGDKLYFIGEHMDLIDKFKPGRTYIDEEINSVDDVRNSIIFKLEKLKEDPILHFACSTYFCDFGKLTSGYNKNEVYKEHIESETQRIRVDMEQYQVMLNRVKELRDNELVMGVELIDKNSDGWSHSPQYDVDIILKDKYDENLTEEYDKLTEFIKKGLNICYSDICWYD